MAVQPALPSPRRPLPRRVDTRRRRIDPPNAFQTSQPFAREPEKPVWIETADAALPALPGMPLVGAAHPPGRMLSRGWIVTLAMSVALHVAVAAFFLMSGSDEDVQIAGSQEAGIVMLGDGPQDQQSAGEMVDEATNVTIVTMLDARPVETVVAAEVTTAEILEPVTETLAEAAPATPAPPVVEDVRALPSVADLLPQVLATDTPEIVAEEEAVAPATPVHVAPSTPPEEIVQETAAPAPAEAAVTEALKPAESETLQPAPELPAVAETPPPVDLKPEPRPERTEPEPRPVEAKKPEPKKAEAKKPVEKPAKAAPAKKAETKQTAGSGGPNKADARKGRTDGEANGTKAQTAGKGKSASAGNADVTNYPGKVVSKLKRQLRRIPASARRSAKQDVHVSFTVTASGGLGGVSIARSSGSPALDKAALDVVRRAAPFPPIPDGRKSWRFSFPLGLK